MTRKSLFTLSESSLGAVSIFWIWNPKQKIWWKLISTQQRNPLFDSKITFYALRIKFGCSLNLLNLKLKTNNLIKIDLKTAKKRVIWLENNFLRSQNRVWVQFKCSESETQNKKFDENWSQNSKETPRYLTRKSLFTLSESSLGAV